MALGTIRRWAGLVILAALLPACGGRHGGPGGSGGPPPSVGVLFNGTGGDVTSLNAYEVGAGGGSSRTAVYSRGEIRIGMDSSPSAPLPPSPPAAGVSVTSADLTGTSFTLASGNILIDSFVTTPTSTPYTITASSGDIVISGTLQAGDGGGTPAGLELHASGTIYITGCVSTRNTDGVADGDPGSYLLADAQSVVVTGSILTGGEDGSSGGWAGLVVLNANGGPSSSVYLIGATINLHGGDATASGDGGPGGGLTIDADGDVYVFGGSIDTSGGAALSTGSDVRNAGGGGTVFISGPGRVEIDSTLTLKGGPAAAFDSSQGWGGVGGLFAINTFAFDTGDVLVFGTIDARGGSATATGPGASCYSGFGGDLMIGNPSPTGAPSSVSLGGGISACGGAAIGSSTTGAYAGDGGTLQLANDYGTAGAIRIKSLVDASGGSGDIAGSGEPNSFQPAIALKLKTGDIEIAGVIAFQGGEGQTQAGNGGLLDISIGDASGTTSGNLTLTGALVGRGGDSKAPAGTAGTGGALTISVLDNGTSVSSSAGVRLEPGSLVDLGGGDAVSASTAGAGGTMNVTANAPVTLSGTVTAGGGSSPAGPGGAGGAVDVFTDPNSLGAGGDVVISPGGIVNVSAGAGAPGGSARNDGALGVTNDIAMLALRISAGALGLLQNNGTILARGGASGGSGGDVLFIGAGPPAAGSQDRTGNGAGSAGDFIGQ